jgi:hypothetical protein
MIFKDESSPFSGIEGAIYITDEKGKSIKGKKIKS